MKQALAARMKLYEEVAKTVLTRRLPVIIRLDGRGFSKFVKRMKFTKPYCTNFSVAMTATALHLAQEAQNCRLVYTQSDEISLLLVDYEQLETEPFFGNEIQKIVSTMAGQASVFFYKQLMRLIMDEGEKKILMNLNPHFDARVFTVPPDDVENYFIWRQKDCTRNAINGLGRSLYSPKELHGKNTNTVLEMVSCQHPDAYANFTNNDVFRLGYTSYKEDRWTPSGDSWVGKVIEYNAAPGRELVRKYVFPTAG